MEQSLILTDLPGKFCGLESCDLLNRKNASWRHYDAVPEEDPDFILTEGGGEHLGTAPHNLPFVSAPSDKRERWAGGIIIVAGKIKVLEEKPDQAPIWSPQFPFHLPCD
jgi:hypothetical protein